MIFSCHFLLFFGVKSQLRPSSWYTVGNTVKLNEDSTFMYSTCGIIQKGTWITSKDTLFLNVKSSVWRNDSLRQFRKHPMVSEKPIKLLIKDNKMVFLNECPF